MGPPPIYYVLGVMLSSDSIAPNNVISHALAREVAMSKKVRSACARNIFKHRRALKMTKSELARKTDMAPSQITVIEAGSQNLTLDVLTRLSKALQTTPSKLLELPYEEFTDEKNFDPDLMKQAIRLQRESLEILKALERKP
ncbi:MAG: XRE family transcriptional regulator [Proteobacteria bacterium]|nr:MAG: XRE family transcriptional regulator [Pseudomonadota bacterium]